MHTTVPSNVGDQQELTEGLEPEEQEETPGSLQQEVYVDLEIYDNEYYTCDSNSDGEGLFVLTDFNDGKVLKTGKVQGTE